MDLNGAALAAQAAANFEELGRIARRMIREGEAARDSLELARGYTFLGNSRLHVFDGDGAERAYAKALDLFQRLDDRAGVARVNMNLGAVAFDIHLNSDEARRRFEQTLPVFMECGDELRYGIALANLGEVARFDGNLVSALEYANLALNVFESIGDSDRATWQLTGIAHYRILRGELREAIGALDSAAVHLSSNKNVHWTVVYFEIWFLIAMQLNKLEAAAHLLDFVDEYRVRHNIPRLRGLLPWLAPQIERLRQRFAPDTLRDQDEAANLTRAHQLVATLRESVPGAR